MKRAAIGVLPATLLAGLLASLAGTALAKLPPLSDAAKAKAAETSARTAWSNKLADYQLCRSMDAVAAGYLVQAKQAGKDVKPPVATPACVDPGPFVYAPPAAASSASAATVASAAAPAASAAKP